LLTDGDVDNPDKVVQLINENRKGSVRVYTLGIGNGCSRYLVE